MYFFLFEKERFFFILEKNKYFLFTSVFHKNTPPNDQIILGSIKSKTNNISF